MFAFNVTLNAEKHSNTYGTNCGGCVSLFIKLILFMFLAYHTFNMITMRDFDILQDIHVLSDDLKSNLSFNYEEMGFMLAPEVKRLPKNEMTRNVWVNSHEDIDYSTFETKSYIEMRFI